MGTYEAKQDAIRLLIRRIYPDVVVTFDLSRRAKQLFAQCYYYKKRITFYRPLFKYTIDSCLHCALHEIAHLMQYEITGKSSHNIEFAKIKDMLIEDYGNNSIMQSKTNRQKSYSKYILDSNPEYRQESTIKL